MFEPTTIAIDLASFLGGILRQISDRLAGLEQGQLLASSELREIKALVQQLLARSTDTVAPAREAAVGEAVEAAYTSGDARLIILQMTTLSPSNAIWKRDLAWFNAQIGDLSH